MKKDSKNRECNIKILEEILKEGDILYREQKEKGLRLRVDCIYLEMMNKLNSLKSDQLDNKQSSSLTKQR